MSSLSFLPLSRLRWLFLSVRVSLLAAHLGRFCWLHCGFFSSGLSECGSSV